MMRYHLITGLVLGFLFLLEEIKADEKDDCFKYGTRFETVRSLERLATRCFKGFPDDNVNALSCIYGNRATHIVHELALKVKTINQQLKYIANPDKLEALRKSTQKCVKNSKDYAYYFNCTLYDIQEICPNDKFFRRKV